MSDCPQMPLLEVQDLVVRVETPDGLISVVDGVSWAIRSHETLALVGESGCGKSMMALAAMGLLPTSARVTGGSIRWKGNPVNAYGSESMSSLRGRRIGMIFQEPLTALNPVIRVGEQIAEVLRHHFGMDRKDANQKSMHLLEQVDIKDAARCFGQYPHQLSGGMRQRVLLAIMLACEPDVLIADEPTTALDVGTQDQILELLRSIQQMRGLGLLLISHDMGAVAKLADTVCVVYAGQVVEYAPMNALMNRPMHPYTQGLLRCRPEHGDENRLFSTIPGAPPQAAAYPGGCRFHPRCELTRCNAAAIQLQSQNPDDQVHDGILARCCHEPRPELRCLQADHWVACHEASIELISDH